MGGSLTGTEVDVVVIRGKIAFATGGDDAVDFPLTNLDITATVDVGPIGSAMLPRAGGERRIPRFASDESDPVTVIDVESSTTSLVAPYALSDGRFDTGFAISNMNTKDGQSGTITFMLYHDGEDVIEYETVSGSPGTGLTSGVLDAGATYVVLLSEILDSAVDYIAPENGFRGYAKIVTDFTGADGVAYISDWAAFTATAVLEEE